MLVLCFKTMNDNKKLELDWRKFEYELVNGKLNINVARLDKLWIALGGSILLAVASAMKTQELKLLYVFLPIISSVWYDTPQNLDRTLRWIGK